MDILTLTSWACWAGAALSLAAYVFSYIRYPRGERLMSTVGLFLTAVALSPIPLFLRQGAEGQPS